ncbi:MAG: Stealth CR1 domain-containing protein [Puniceicoccales bacterium]|jgi:hypothetical protein|nr:Stealth CR1 domain-containing protein [Puniceicoccales bacterium]
MKALRRQLKSLIYQLQYKLTGHFPTFRGEYLQTHSQQNLFPSGTPFQTITDPFPITFPIDAVYTWVNQNDPEWQKAYNTFLDETRFSSQLFQHRATSMIRYNDHQELYYSLLSLKCYAPWVRKIFIIISDLNEVPSFLKHWEKIAIIRHSDIIDASFLPTFNSHVIEACLHRIPDLAEHYIYFNDDVFLGSPTTPNDFFSCNGMAHKLFSSKRILLEPDNPTQMADGQVKALLEKEYGLTIMSRFLHLTHTQQKSIAEMIERRHPEIYRELLPHRFRSPTDWTIAILLHHYVAFLEGKAVMKTFPKTAYIQLGSCGYKSFLKKILHGRKFTGDPYKIFCLNESL